MGSLHSVSEGRVRVRAHGAHVAAFVTGLGQGPQTGEDRLSAGALAWRGDGEIKELR